MKKIIIILSIVIAVFGYAVLDAVKVDRMLQPNTDAFKTGSVITKLPPIEFSEFGNDSIKSSIRSVIGLDKAVLVHFWATWCAPCEKEFPELVEVIDLLSTTSEVAFVLIAVDDQLKNIKKFLKQYNLKFQNIYILEDKTESHKNFGTYKLPESYLFDSSGNLVKKLSGKQQWMDKKIINLLKSM
jgi:cytochrome c biogenesis protein CcmG/thiol:disulfide interchange protein DsbE